MSQITYEELYRLIEQMTSIQRKHPVKMFIPTDGELHPEDQSTHPECSFSSKLVLAQEIEDIHSYEDEVYENQYVILEYMDEESSKKCQILHCRRILVSEYSTVFQKEYALNELKTFGEDISEFIEPI